MEPSLPPVAGALWASLAQRSSTPFAAEHVTGLPECLGNKALLTCLYIIQAENTQTLLWS